jgi:hypothetical protein
MSNNQLDYKKRVAPEWYLDGPVKIYTREEIDEYERTCDPRVWQKVEAQRGLSEKDIRWLDGMRLTQEETMFEEIMEGNHESEGSTDGIA